MRLNPGKQRQDDMDSDSILQVPGCLDLSISIEYDITEKKKNKEKGQAQVYRHSGPRTSEAVKQRRKFNLSGFWVLTFQNCFILGRLKVV